MASETETFGGSGELHAGSGYDRPWSKGGADPGDVLLEGITDSGGQTGVNATLDSGSGASIYTGSEQGTDAMVFGQMSFDRTRLAVCAKLQDEDNYAAFHLDGNGSIGLRLEVREGAVEDDGDVRTQGAADLWVKLEANSSGDLELFTGGTGASPSWGSVGSHATQHFGSEGTQGLKADAGTQVSTDTVHYFEITFDSLGGGGTTDDLTAQDIATGSPTVDSASIAQNHALTGADIATQSPVVESASISQQHALTAQDVAAQAPTVDSPDLSESHQLTAQDVAAQAPTVDSPGISQVHGLTAQDVATQAPAVESPSIGQVHALSAQDVAAGSPVVDSATLSSDTTDALTAQDITAGTPTVGAADLSQNHALAVADILSAAPQITSPAITQVHVLTAQDVVAGVPAVDSATLNAAIISARPGDGPNITQLLTGSPNKTELVGGPNTTELQ